MGVSPCCLNKENKHQQRPKELRPGVDSMEAMDADHGFLPKLWPLWIGGEGDAAMGFPVSIFSIQELLEKIDRDPL